MADVPQVTIVAGLPTAGDGTVQTLSTTNAVIGPVTETAPATDTASSGANGRLQRIAQRITSLIALLPAAFTAGGGVKVGLVDAIPAGSAAIGKLAANSGVNVGEVSIIASQVLLPGQAAMAASMPMVIASNQTTLPVTPASQSHVGSMTFTPAAASHTGASAGVEGDCNGAATSCTSMGLASSSVIITSASLKIDGGTAEATAWRLYLYSVTPPSALADDAPWDLPSGDRASFLGYIDLGTAVDKVSTQWVETHGINKQIRLGATPSIFAYLVNLTTLIPANVAHVVTLHTIEV